MIFRFSGTGNSALVARRLSELLGGEPIKAITSSPEAAYHPGEEEHIIWVFPVYGWGVPSVVRRFMRRVNLSGNRGRHFMVCTCGDDCGLTYRQWRKELRRRGWTPGAAFSVQMPNTYVSLPGFDVDTPEVAASKLEAMPARVAKAARAITHSARIDDTFHGRFAWLKTRVLYPLFTRLLMSPRPFRSTDACIGCGKCAAACPMDNITMSADHRPCWGKNCAGCLACYHACPQHAVEWSCFTKSKGQYSLPAELRQGCHS